MKRVHQVAAVKKVLLVDDHPIVRQGLKQLIEQEVDLVVCGEAESTHEALAGIAKLEPDVVIVDLGLKDSSGIDLIKQITSNKLDVLVLVLSMHDESLYVERALRAGARGYLTKEEAPDRVVPALRRVLGGKTYLSEVVSEKVVGRLVGTATGVNGMSIECLTDRELEIFELYGKGLGTRHISERLKRSIKTVQAHRENIKKKLNLDSPEELVRHATEWIHHLRSR